MNPNPTNSKWAPLPFARLAVNHPGGITLVYTREIPEHCKLPKDEYCVAEHKYRRKFLRVGYSPIELTCEVTHSPHAVIIDYDIPVLPSMPEWVALGFLKRFDEWTDLVLSNARARANFDINDAHAVTDGMFFTVFIERGFLS